MLLSKDNLAQWKEELKKEMFRQYYLEDYDEAYEDEEWLDKYSGQTVQMAIDEEVDSWEP